MFSCPSSSLVEAKFMRKNKRKKKTIALVR